MIIEVSDNLTGQERLKYIKDFQIEYFYTRHKSLLKTSSMMGVCVRALRNYIKRDPVLREKYSKPPRDIVKGRTALINYLKSNIEEEHHQDALKYLEKRLKGDKTPTNKQLASELKQLFIGD